MDHENNVHFAKHPDGKAATTAGESASSEGEKKACTSGTATEEQHTNGSWSQRTISRLLRSTFNPRMRWLFPGQSQDDTEDEEEEEGNLVKAHNLVSRSSARLVRLQHALLSVAMQRQHVGGSLKVCIKGLPAEGKVHFAPSSVFLNEHYQALWRLVEQRSLLLFIHEYTRRAHTTAAYISKVGQQLEDHLWKSHLTSNQTQHLCSSVRVHLRPLCQEFRIHLNHWSCLSAKVQSDPHLRRALGQHNKLLGDIRQTLDLLGLQALVLMERYVHAVLSAVAQADLDHIPREVLADILDSTDLYSQVVEEQRIQHSVTERRSHILQQTMSQRHHPTAVSVKDLLSTLAVQHANAAAKQLHRWTCQQCLCPSHTKQTSLPARFTSPATWEQLQNTFFISCSSPKMSHVYTPELHLEKQRHSCRCQTCIHKTGSVQTHQECKSPVRNSQRFPMAAPPTSFSHLSTIPLFRLCQQDRSKVELLFHVLASSNDLLAPLVSHSSPAETTMQTFPCAETKSKADQKLAALSQSIEDCSVEGNDQEAVELEITTTPTVHHSSDAVQAGPVEAVGAKVQTAERECARQPRSVQWLDLDQSLVFEDLLGHYYALLWARCSKALWLQMHAPLAGRSVGSVNLHDNQRRFQVLQMISQASKTDLLPKEGRAVLEEFSLNMLGSTARAQWDYVVCRSLGAALNDKCQTYVNQPGRSLTPPSNCNETVMMSQTAENLLQLSPPLLSCLSSCSAAGSLNLFPSRNALCRWTMNLMLATVQLSTVWIMSKSYQFLSSWSLNKFLLITQGDLNVLRESLDAMVQQTACLTMELDGFSAHHVHNQHVFTQQHTKLDIAVSQLQTLSSLVLETFSKDCKRRSADAFEQTMPPARHWRLNHRPGLPSSPSEYASLAAQNTIGQVLEGVTSLSDDACIQALSVSTTAFMEAWMEHILKHKIKFSVQGALQLKQDFDSIRELICSDAYGLPEELHQQLLGLRVFQQVDSAVLCLLQQPHIKPYLHSTAWEPVLRCCATKRSRDSLNAPVGSSISNLRGMEGEAMTQSNPSVVTTDIPSVDPFIPGEPYLAPSLVLGASQQEWLDLRIHNGCRRWRLPGLRCLSKSEP